MKNGFVIGFASAVVLLVVISFSNTGASFSDYAPKLLKFEGKGYGIHKPIWGHRKFSKTEALNIHKHHYWNRYHGDLFDNQSVAEVLIDHLINAGDGRTKQNIKAFEKMIGVEPDGVISEEDVYSANAIEDPNWLVNQYVDYRVSYYNSLKKKKYITGWLRRANSFKIEENESIFSSIIRQDLLEETAEESTFVLNPQNSVEINGVEVNRKSKTIKTKNNESKTDIIEDL